MANRNNQGGGGGGARRQRQQQQELIPPRAAAAPVATINLPRQTQEEEQEPPAAAAATVPSSVYLEDCNFTISTVSPSINRGVSNNRAYPSGTIAFFTFSTFLCTRLSYWLSFQIRSYNSKHYIWIRGNKKSFSHFIAHY